MSDPSITTKVTADVSGYKKGMQDAAEVSAEFRKAAEDAATGADALGKSQAASGVQAQTAGEAIGDLVGALQGSTDAVMNLLQRFVGAGGLIGVLGTGALAVGVLGVAAYKGAREVEVLEESAIMAGDRIALTTGQMLRMAEGIDQISGTSSDAIDALTVIAAGGKVTGNAIEDVARVAVRMKDVVGQSIQATVREFESLKDAPSKAVLDLNEKYGFLTASVFEQIAALEQQGRIEEATALASKTLADELDSRATRIEANLGILSRAWKTLGDTASEAIDAMLSIGRPDSLESQITAQQALIAKIENVPWRKQALGQERDHLEHLREQLRMQRAAVAQTAARKTIDDQAVAALGQIYTIREKTLSAEERLNAELKKYRDNVEAIRRANPSSAEISPDRIRADEAAIRSKFTPRSTPTRSPREDLNAGFDTAAAQSYTQTMAALSKVQEGAAIDAMNLNEAQSILMRAMMSPEWYRMPEPWRQLQIAKFELVNADLEAGKAQREHAEALKEGERLTAAMRTPSEALGVEIAHLNQLLGVGAIDWETYSRAVFGAQDEFDRLVQKGEEAGSVLEGIWEQAGRGIQSTLATYLFDPFEAGLNGMLLGFLDVIRRMAAEAAAAQILQQVAGWGKTNAGGGGWVGALAGVVGSLFGGGRASGGDVAPGRLYEVSEQGRPELLNSGGRTYLLMGQQGGTVVPASGGDSGSAPNRGVQVTIITNITGNGSEREERGSGSQGAELGRRIETVVRTVIATEMRPGGMLSGG